MDIVHAESDQEMLWAALRLSALRSFGVFMNQEIDSRVVWDTALACDLVGKVLLVGVSYYEADGSVSGQEQFFGTVELANSDNGIVLNLDGNRIGEEVVLPPDTRSVYRAAPGEYRLRSTGEVVVDPDFTATYNVRKHAA